MSLRRITGTLAALATLAILLSPAAATAQTAQFCKGVRATIVGTEGDDVLRGTEQRDVIVALGGDDRIVGGRGNDLICAGRGRDVVTGGAGKDTIFGGTGNDLLRGGSARDTLDGGGGNDRVFGHGGDDILSGGPGRDRIVADTGSDSCVMDTDDPLPSGCEQRNWKRLSGVGDAVVSTGLNRSFIVENDCRSTHIRCEYYVAVVRLDGTTGFDALGIEAFDNDGNHIVSYGDAGDSYGGVFVFRGRPASIEIDSGGGAWSVTFVKKSGLLRGGRTESGSGNHAYLVDRPLKGLVTARMRWTGFGNFAVIGVSPTDGRDLLANEVRFSPGDVPPFSTESVARTGITLVQVLSDDGTWTVALSG